jgi:hypothetical protein
MQEILVQAYSFTSILIAKALVDDNVYSYLGHAIVTVGD